MYIQNFELSLCKSFLSFLFLGIVSCSDVEEVILRDSQVDEYIGDYDFYDF
ncbi:MAG: hypothetical protein N2746_03445 [Deltaproteobacteria bacterium]|nr:hypothetical protein [Deltaproteobacteria bacterium]